MFSAPKIRRLQFQSTHPVRGATFIPEPHARPIRISIHAPREGCDIPVMVVFCGFSKFQSTHPVRGATIVHKFSPASLAFQSTHPVRGATEVTPTPTATMPISIHAPREGCDESGRVENRGGRYFNPRTP